MLTYLAALVPYLTAMSRAALASRAWRRRALFP
jgi:hypothetical protein